MAPRALLGSLLGSTLCAVLLSAAPAAAEPPAPAPATAAPPAANAAPPASTAPPAAPAPPAAAQAAKEATTYAVRLADLERRIAELKERHPARRGPEVLKLSEIERRIESLRKGVAALQQRVQELARLDPAQPAPSPPVKPATAVSSLENRLGPAMRLTRIRVIFDGEIVLDKADTKALGQREIPLFIGAVSPGEHTLSVQVEAAPSTFGVFVYADAFRFTAQAVQKIGFEEGKAGSVRVIVHEKGGVTAPFAQRLAIGVVTWK